MPQKVLVSHTRLRPIPCRIAVKFSHSARVDLLKEISTNFKETCMKKLFTLIVTMVLAAGLSFAQTGGGTTDKGTDKGTGKTAESGKKTEKSKGKKGGKKGKKSSGGTTTPAPK